MTYEATWYSIPVQTSFEYTKGRVKAPPRGHVQRRSPPSTPNAKLGRWGLTWAERSFLRLWRWTARRWLAVFSRSRTSPTPHTAAIHAPRTPSERQPSPYWYFGPSSSRSARASGEYSPTMLLASWGLPARRSFHCTFWTKYSPFQSSVS